MAVRTCICRGVVKIEQVKTFSIFLFISTRFALLLLQDTEMVQGGATQYIFSCCIVCCDVIEVSMKCC